MQRKTALHLQNTLKFAAHEHPKFAQAHRTCAALTVSSHVTERVSGHGDQRTPFARSKLGGRAGKQEEVVDASRHVGNGRLARLDLQRRRFHKERHRNMRAIWQREDACGGHDETGTSNGSDRDTETKEVQQRLERRAGRRTAVIRAAADGACLVHHEARRDGVAGEPALDPVRAARAA